MDFRHEVRMPPRLETPDGQERRVGVELEFAAVSARAGAHFVQSLFGGEICEEDPHRFHIRGTTLGDFTSELDTQYAHRAYGKAEFKPAAQDPLGKLLADFRDELRTLYGNVSSLVVPCEIVCPPIAISKLTELEKLVDLLTKSGAEGTRSNPFYAFGAQLNPEIANQDPQWLIAMFKAYLLLSDWLRAIMEIDTTRRLVAFADPFPAPYVAKVLHAAYWPDMPQFMEDYLLANPTRNRELDLLPLFSWHNNAHVQRHIYDLRIKARPTFHYRLPDANLGEPDWTIIREWNRWCVVEQIADSRDLLDKLGTQHRENRARALPRNWAIKVSEWLVLS